MSRNEDGLLSEAVDDDEDSGVAVGVGELLYEVHGDGIPRAFGDGELLQSAVWCVSGDLRSFADGAGLAVVADKASETRPGVVAEYESLSLVLAPVSSCRMVVAGAEYA